MRGTLVRGFVLALLAAVMLTATAGAFGVGDKAPEFTLPAAGQQQPVKLSDLLGKGPVVIYTAIQAFTPT
jgi:AhpC/TSA family